MNRKIISFTFLYFCALCISAIQGQDQKMRTMPDLSIAEAQWISRDTIVWKKKNLLPESDCVYKLYYHPSGDIRITENGLQTGESGEWYTLPQRGSVGDGQDSEADKKLASLPFLKGRERIDASSVAYKIGQFIQGWVVIAIEDRHGNLLDATSLQIAGLLDDVYEYKGNLGIVWNGQGTFFLRLWAPTAKSVQVRLYTGCSDEKETQIIHASKLMDGSRWTGVWETPGTKEWKGMFYLYEIELFVFSGTKPVLENQDRLGRIESYLVTDPYSISLSANSKRSQIVDLSDPTLKPAGWDSHAIPALNGFEDIVIYELHVRDFSISDPTVPSPHQGTFMAFTHKESAGMSHLRRLAASGLTHIHLLPVFDITTVEEYRQKQKIPKIPKISQESAPDKETTPNKTLSDKEIASNSEEPQKAVHAVQDQDGFNWGYDPYHYMVPEGGYSTDPEGSGRIFEFREMVRSLHESDLRVIMDVVFNHTHSAFQESSSVLDKIVPGYYYRLDDKGKIQGTTCCPDTATEHKMMEKLMVDSVRLWAIYYKIDGFRFDLMGHHTVDNMRRIRKELDSLTLEKDGVDGKKIYLYGEGWKFGSLDAILPDKACNQLNSYGLGIGTFNDRIRDSLRGGRPIFFDPPAQGFITGIYHDFNKCRENVEVPANLDEQRAILLNLMENIQLGMAGNLRDFPMPCANGKTVPGKDILYRGSPNAGYTASPQECINYVEVHDNMTLWDCIQAKAPFHTEGREPETATIQERVRMQNLAISIIGLSQGIPLFHAGMDMLRSKSGDCDSYNSGDWFNRLDFTYQTNNWGVGLPIAEKNQNAWDFWRPRLADKTIRPAPEDIRFCVGHILDILSIRKSSPLFRLKTSEDVIKRVRFPNAERGSKQIPGLIVMEIRDDLPSESRLDPDFKRVVAFFNATREDILYADNSWRGIDLILHPILRNSKDEMVKRSAWNKNDGYALIPGRTASVWCEIRK